MVHFVNELWREMEVATAARVVEYGGDRRAAPGALERVVGQKEPSRDLSSHHLTSLLEQSKGRGGELTARAELTVNHPGHGRTSTARPAAE